MPAEPISAKSLVERLRELADTQIDDNLTYIRSADELMLEAAALITDLERRLTERATSPIEADEKVEKAEFETFGAELDGEGQSNGVGPPDSKPSRQPVIDPKQHDNPPHGGTLAAPPPSVPQNDVLHLLLAERAGGDDIDTALARGLPFGYDPATGYLHANDGGAPASTIFYEPATAHGPAAAVTEAMEWCWEAKWYGSDPQKGCTIWAMTQRGAKARPIAYIGPDEVHLELGRKIAEAHNAALAQQAPSGGAPDSAVPDGWRIERMLEIIGEAFGLVDGLHNGVTAQELARLQGNLISVLSYEDWTIPSDFDEVKRMLAASPATTEQG